MSLSGVIVTFFVFENVEERRIFWIFESHLMQKSCFGPPVIFRVKLTLSTQTNKSTHNQMRKFVSVPDRQNLEMLFYNLNAEIELLPYSVALHPKM